MSNRRERAIQAAYTVAGATKRPLRQQIEAAVEAYEQEMANRGAVTVRVSADAPVTLTAQILVDGEVLTELAPGVLGLKDSYDVRLPEPLVIAS